MTSPTIPPNDSKPKASRPSTISEHIASVVLALVIFALGWIILAAWKVSWIRLPSLEMEVILVVGLLVAALLMVSVVALREE